ncbi:MAG TPA: SGNH/GDSL hydrolase family protein, partial [Pyrinomonadaceae bacterium]|nr:SGNH/GDSL hydrolase family protein [Pyrinomonadaceae bacterium]
MRDDRLKWGACLFALLIFLVTSAASCAQSEQKQKEKRSNMGAGQQGEVVAYTALGDSTGAGVGAKQGGGYVARLFERIKREHPEARLTNLCVSGSTTDDVLREQLRPAINSRPSIVTLGIGINDIGHGMSVERFSANYEEIIGRLGEETSARIVVTNIPDISFAPVVPQSERDNTRRVVQLFNKKIHQIAERHRLLVVDVYSETHRVIPEHPEFFSEDGFHPSDDGYEYWAET